jgi:LPPG:FO 2-phospho-L-lactate transferase
MIVALAGGVGGAKLAQGLYAELDPESLTVICNTGDDFELYGLRIAPDADTVLYTLAGLANPETGWGIIGDTYATLGMLRRYGSEDWFLLGDRDFATHILRTARLHAGASPSDVLGNFARALGVRAMLLPMCDEPVATLVRTPIGELAFQEYFVHRHHRDLVLGVRFAGIEAACVPAPVRKAVRAADAIVFCPSNPIVSIGPILAVPSMRDLLRETAAPRVAVSPIVAGRALRGPADQMLRDLGHEVSPYGVSLLYRDLLHGIVIDRADAAEAERITALGMAVLVTETVMGGLDDRRRLAAEVLRFAHGLRERASGARP